MNRIFLVLCLALMGFGLSSCTTYVEDSRPGYAYRGGPSHARLHSLYRSNRYDNHHRSSRYDNDRRTVRYDSTRDRYRNRRDRDRDYDRRVVDTRVRASVSTPVRLY